MNSPSFSLISPYYDAPHGAFSQEGLPPEITESIRAFQAEHPDPSNVAFIMMRFGTTKAHEEILQTLRKHLQKHGIAGLRADDRGYHDDLWFNILIYIHGCGFGIAVFERLEGEEFNPNVELEVGYMMALRKPILLLKDKTLKSLNADLIGRLFKTFDPQAISKTIGPLVRQWLEDKGIGL